MFDLEHVKQESEETCSYRTRTLLRGCIAEIERLRGALNKIAAWEDGPVVTGGFDSPSDATTAREVLSGTHC